MTDPRPLLGDPRLFTGGPLLDVYPWPTGDVDAPAVTTDAPQDAPTPPGDVEPAYRLDEPGEPEPDTDPWPCRSCNGAGEDLRTGEVCHVCGGMGEGE